MRWFLSLLTCALAHAQVATPARWVNFYSLEREKVLGAQLAQQIRQSTTPIPSALVSECLNGLCGKLATQLADTPFLYTVSPIFEDRGGETHEPLSVPGGYIFAPADLLRSVKNEAELAGMLAHAMAHAALRHGTLQATKVELANIDKAPLVPLFGWMSFGTHDTGTAVPIAFLAGRRQGELEADALAVWTVSAAGIDPAEFVRYISRVQTDATPVRQVFATLPARSVRLANLEKAIQKLGPRTYEPTRDLTALQDEIRKLTAGQERPTQRPSLYTPPRK